MARKPKSDPKAPRTAEGAVASRRPASAGAEPVQPSFALSDHRKRADRSWSTRALWQGLYDSAYEYAVPYRRPSARSGPAASRTDRIFDNTAIVSTFRFAGQLQNDLFPPGQPFFKLAPGPMASVLLKDVDKVELARQLEEISKVIQALFLSSEWDTAVHETCIDLAVGTGCLLIVEGDDDRPVRFVNIPADEVAIEPGPYNDLALISWKTRMTRRQIRAAFPKGDFCSKFQEGDNSRADEEVEIAQDFVLEDKRWRFVAYCSFSERPIVDEWLKAQPMAVPRYFRVPGEAYGRGPVLLALPTIKTLNKAVELQLKSAAIQMLGIWGYRPGGAFNPDTARIAPGAFWAMQATGGVLGADVTRLDPAAGRIDVGNLISQEMRLQVQAALHDTQLGPESGTPKSATEIMARMRRISENYMGAFGRLVHEIVPVVVRRVIEIAHKKGLIDKAIPIDDLLVRVDVLSPIAAALKAQALNTIVEFCQLVASIRGPQAVELTVKVDDALKSIGLGMGVPAEFLLTEDERRVVEGKIAAAAAAVTQATQAAGADPAANDPSSPGAAA